MDHAISQLREHMRATISVYRDVPVEEIRGEIKAYVDALNKLELYYYGEVRTSFEEIMLTYFE